MTHTIPSAEAYANEPVRFPPLVVVDLASEAAAVTDAYRNQVISQVNTSCLRLAVITGDYHGTSILAPMSFFWSWKAGSRSSWPTAAR